MKIVRSSRFRGARRVGVVAAVLLVLMAVRAAAPPVESAAGVTDAVTGERLGELTYGLTPARLLDTRLAATVDQQYSNVGKFVAGIPFVLPVRGRGGIPSAATGVLVNLTVSDPGGAGYLSVWPEGASPGTSNVNFVKGQTIANFTFVAIGADGSIRLQLAEADAHVIVDVVAFTSDLPTI